MVLKSKTTGFMCRRDEIYNQDTMQESYFATTDIKNTKVEEETAEVNESKVNKIKPEVVDFEPTEHAETERKLLEAEQSLKNKIDWFVNQNPDFGFFIDESQNTVTDNNNSEKDNKADVQRADKEDIQKADDYIPPTEPSASEFTFIKPLSILETIECSYLYDPITLLFALEPTKSITPQIHISPKSLKILQLRGCVKMKKYQLLMIIANLTHVTDLDVSFIPAVDDEVLRCIRLVFGVICIVGRKN